MNFALLKKSFRDGRWLLAGSVLLLFAFGWLRVWISSLFPLANLEGLLSFVPKTFERMMPVPFAQVATPAGRIAIAFDDPLVLLVVSVWAVARGSDVVSGELNRGTMEMLLAQPVRRTSVLATQGAVTLLGAGALALATWGGIAAGLALIDLEPTTEARLFLPATVNLFALTVFLAGLTTMFSAASNYRSRTIGLVGTIFIISMVLKIIGRLAPGWGWLSYLSFLTPFEPQQFVGDPALAWSLFAGPWQLGGLGCDALLVGLGFAGFCLAAVIFARRDLPAPL